jgi:two-component system cell cycle response regulator
MNTLENEIERSRHGDKPLSIVMLDIDCFKKINDTYGQQICDNVQEEMEHIMGQALRPSDTVGQYGNGEFILILPNTDCAGACELAEKIRSSMATVNFRETELKISVSASVATWEKHKVIDWLRKAGSGLYDENSKGKIRAPAVNKLAGATPKVT